MGFFSSLFGKKEASTDTAEELIPSKIEDICYALGCLVGFAAITDPEENLASLFVRLHYNNNTTEIYANCQNWIHNSKNINDYTRLKVPTNIASFLTKVPFDEGRSSPLTMTVDCITDQYAIEESIKKGVNLLPYQPGICQIKTYKMEKSNTICIDLSIAKD